LFQISIQAAIWPANGDTLFQTQVMFQWNEIAFCDQYRLTIETNDLATGLPQNVSDHKMNSLALLVSNCLEPGKKYEWMYRAYQSGILRYTSPRFTVYISASLKKEQNGLVFSIPINKKKETADCIILDGCGAAINYSGNLVWQLKETAIREKQKGIAFRNMEINPQGNISLLVQNSFYETNLQGKILWQAIPSGIVSNDSIEYYHHDGKRLKNGNYLVCSFRMEKESCYHDPEHTCNVKYGTLLELDSLNRLVWWWNEKGHVLPADVYLKNAPGTFDITGSHLNGFDINETTNKILMSFRDNNRIIMIDKNSGNVLADLKPGIYPGIVYNGQHSPVFLNNNQWLFYNNNLQRGREVEGEVVNASIIKIKFEPRKKPEKFWEYICSSDSFPAGTTGKEGYCQPLQNGNYLVCMGGLNRLFEMTPKGNVVWECFTKQINSKDKKIEPFTNYRAHQYSSLYPLFFTVQQLQKKVTGRTEIKINNDGSDEQEFEILLKGKKNKQLQIVSIKAGKSNSFHMVKTKKKQLLLIKPVGVNGFYKELTL
jgi:hypothetical protein